MASRKSIGSISAADGTFCNDENATTVQDACTNQVCAGIPATCGNQNITCPVCDVTEIGCFNLLKVQLERYDIGK
jgi:hypothetical protein